MTTEQPLREGQHVDSRDFRVKAITLIGSDGTAREVSPMVAEVQVRQDIYLGFMSGELLITDGVDLHSQMGIHGGEYVFLHFIVPEQEIEIRKAFRIYKVSNRTPIENAQQYTIHFMSDELFRSYTIKISKSYVNETISNVVSDVLKNYLKVAEQRIFVDSTTGTVNLVIPNWRPLEVLNWLASFAYNSTQDTYFFYENLEGYHFKSLQTIYKAGTKIKVPFTFENKQAQKNLDMDKFAMDSLESKRDFDILATVAAGGYAMRLTTVDPHNQEWIRNDFAMSDLNSLYENPTMTDIDDLFKKAETHNLTYLNVEGIDKWIRRVMSLAVLNNSLLEMAVPGNMGLEIGTLVNIRVPYAVPPSDGDMWDKRKSGKYLVAAVNHKFDMVTHKFTSLVAMVRDSLPESLPNPDKTLPEKIRKLES